MNCIKKKYINNTKKNSFYFGKFYNVVNTIISFF